MASMQCDNCGQQRRSGRFCPECGQSDRDFQRALPPLVGELIREAFEIDSRLLRSMKTLLFAPGVLSLEFSRNRRANYVSPVRMYLFASLVFFFALSMSTEFDMTAGGARPPASAAPASASDIARLEGMLGPREREQLQEILARPESSIARQAVMELASSLADDPPGPVGRFMVGAVVGALQDPADMFETLLEELPVAMFVMLPVYAGLLKLFYLRRHRFYVEHLVFALHVHTVTFIVFTVVVLLPGAAARPLVSSVASVAGNGLMLALAAYQYLALKKFYGGSHPATMARFLGLALSYLLVLAPGILVVVLVALTFG